ncbi:phosphotransferase [Phytohabitans sp. LJ34]|uniref:phosphotransferase n=1 Tax=Phytohabitans sp. LJ34 TaxID=3452217 RepID=UPI003F8A50A8
MSHRKPDVPADALHALLHKAFGASVSYRRTAEGMSTQVYQVHTGTETFYLRVAEEADENLETDAELHQRLRDLGVKVASVVYVEAFNADIGRSVMITTEVPGAAPARTAPVVADAGADLAVLNQVPVDGFGFVRRRGRRWPLRAEYATYPPYLTSYLPQTWPGPLASLFATPVLDTIEGMVEHERDRPPARAVLAHGDFDTTHIFHTGDRYTGLIDFGEIRGTEPFFDLSHFHLHDREALLPALLDGYQRVQPLPADHGPAIQRGAVLLALRQLCRWLGPPQGRPLDHPAVTNRARRIHELLTQPW